MGIFIPVVVLLPKLLIPWKALIPILVRADCELELTENIKVVKLLHPWKALTPIDVTVAGIVTFVNRGAFISALPQL